MCDHFLQTLRQPTHHLEAILLYDRNQLRMLSTHRFFICPATYTNFSVILFTASPINIKMFFVELPIPTADFSPIKLNLALTHTVAQLGKMCQGILIWPATNIHLLHDC